MPSKSAGSHQWPYLVQVRTLVQRELYAALAEHDALISPAAPTAAYRIGQVNSDPLEMYKGDLMTVNINLAGQLPSCLKSTYQSQHQRSFGRGEETSGSSRAYSIILHVASMQLTDILAACMAFTVNSRYHGGIVFDLVCRS